MCGRVATIDNVEDYLSILPGDFNLIEGDNQYKLNFLTELPPSFISYNLPPSKLLPVITNDSPKALQIMPWRYDIKIRGQIKKLSNSMIEKAQLKNGYLRYDLQERRCVVLVKGYYEWALKDPSDIKSQKQSVFVHLSTSPVMPFAGIYKKNEDGSVGCSVLTKTPLSRIERIHHRMPYILQPESIFDYLSPRLDRDRELIVDWLGNNLIDNNDLDYYPVGPLKGDHPTLLNKCEPIFEI